eukprot:TRINITY_DN17434_c0_g1_i1.p1 TRINITY_DN17434_c0_g1~~TRINITY_DN17434_c0_g1_i1.p1  ORF type:complete len:398 (+),score=125.13 TRINITY_DN17434_c0_g1_i1:120-1313(+)
MCNLRYLFLQTALVAVVRCRLEDVQDELAAFTHEEADDLIEEELAGSKVQLLQRKVAPSIASSASAADDVEGTSRGANSRRLSSTAATAEPDGAAAAKKAPVSLLQEGAVTAPVKAAAAEAATEAAAAAPGVAAAADASDASAKEVRRLLPATALGQTAAQQLQNMDAAKPPTPAVSCMLLLALFVAASAAAAAATSMAAGQRVKKLLAKQLGVDRAVEHMKAIITSDDAPKLDAEALPTQQPKDAVAEATGSVLPPQDDGQQQPEALLQDGAAGCEEKHADASAGMVADDTEAAVGEVSNAEGCKDATEAEDAAADDAPAATSGSAPLPAKTKSRKGVAGRRGGPQGFPVRHGTGTGFRSSARSTSVRSNASIRSASVRSTASIHSVRSASVRRGR